MPKKRLSAEQIVTLLRQIEVLMAQCKSTLEACRDAGISLVCTENLICVDGMTESPKLTQ